MNKIHKLFPIAILVCGIVPFFHTQYIGIATLFHLVVFSVASFVIALILTDAIKGAEKCNKKALSPFFLLGLVLPFSDIFFEIKWSDVFFLAILCGFIFFKKWKQKCKWWISAIFALLLSGLLAMNFEYHQEKQDIVANKTQSISGSIPKDILEISRHKYYKIYFVFNEMKFDCAYNVPFLCRGRDVFQYANQHAQIHYILENNEPQRARIVSVQVGDKIVWSPEQTLAWYEAREQKIWREFLGGLLLIGLPFLLLYFWARKIVVQAA